MNKISYKLASIDDIPEVIDMRIAFLTELSGPHDEETVRTLKAALHNYFINAISENSFICFLALVQNEIAGIGAVVLRQRAGYFANPNGKEGYIMCMYTRPEFRKRGISTEILNRLMAEAKSKGTCFFELHATKEGEPVYIKNGFIQHHEPTYRKNLL